MLRTLQGRRRRPFICVFIAMACWLGAACGACRPAALHAADHRDARLDRLLGRPVDVAPDAYAYRADRSDRDNPPESGILLMQYANLSFDEPLVAHRAKTASVVTGLLWEEVRPVRHVELSWASPATATGKRQPAPEEIDLFYFDTADDTAHTWWNPRVVKSCGKPEVAADGRIYSWNIPVDTWAVVAALRDGKPASDYAVPSQIRALTPEVWKTMDLEIHWGFDDATTAADYTGGVTAYGGIVERVDSLDGDAATTVACAAWQSAGAGTLKSLGRPYRGVRMSLAYQGTSRWRRVWPYHAQPEDVARTIVTVSTRSGRFSFLASDLELGPILAPEYGFFVRAVSRREPAAARSSAVKPPPPPPMVPLPEKMDAIPGVPKVRGWASNTIPWFGVNASDERGQSGSLAISSRSAAMHPEPTRDVAAVWRSPIVGRVSVSGRVVMGDSAGGNGVTWAIVRDHGTERTTLVAGAVDAGGAAAFPAPTQEKTLAAVNVAAGDTLALVLGAKGGDHVCDTTIVQLALREVGGQGRTWDLTRDVIDSIHAGNPHADRLGNAGAWSFCAVAASQPPHVPTPSEPPFRMASPAKTAAEFRAELAARGLKTIRQRTREHAEQTWLSAVTAMQGNAPLPPHPKSPREPAMQVDVPCERLTAQWKLGAWHILRRSAQQPDGEWRFNDYPFGILSSETYMILRALDLQGMHREAADGLSQWLRLPLEPRITPGQGGHHPWAKPDRPLGHFSDGRGCFTHAEGIDGAGGHMDAVHAMGPGAIVFTMAEHFRLTGDRKWLAAHAPRIRANAEWILRQRKLLRTILPGGEQLWSRGLQPAHVVTPDSMSMHMQFYESEAYYWLAVKRTAEMLALSDPTEGARMAAEAEAYRRDLLAVIERSIALSPVVAVRDGTYRSFIPFAPYVRGFAAGAWGWRRCQGHVGAIYWDTVQSADPLVSPSGLLAPHDRRVQGHLDVLEDRLLLENTKVHARTAGYDAARHWFAHASWQYQCGLERHANIHLAADDVPNFLRSMLNQYAVDIMPGEYTFREHTTGGPPDKIYEESCFLERFRQMLVMEDGGVLWLARATPREWLAQGKHIAVRNAPTHFGPVSYRIESDAANGTIRATVEMPARLASQPLADALLRLRHPTAAQLQSVEVNGKPWTDFDAPREIIRLPRRTDRIDIVARYGTR